jgi:hypothetical protein
MKNSWYTAVVVGILFSGLAHADGIIVGTYQGEGQWRDNAGNSGEYSVRTEVSPDQVQSEYRWSAETRHWGFAMQNQSVGFYAITDNFGSSGSMYCYSVQCHYEFNTARLTTEETLSFVDGKLYKLGSKRMPNGLVISWEEALSLK